MLRDEPMSKYWSGWLTHARDWLRISDAGQIPPPTLRAAMPLYILSSCA